MRPSFVSLALSWAVVGFAATAVAESPEGYYRQPSLSGNIGVYGPEGDWLIEGWGVEPDIVVDNLPHATFNGEDAQLQYAIDYLKDKIESEPVDDVLPPPHPDKSGPN